MAQQKKTKTGRGKPSKGTGKKPSLPAVSSGFSSFSGAVIACWQAVPAGVLADLQCFLMPCMYNMHCASMCCMAFEYRDIGLLDECDQPSDAFVHLPTLRYSLLTCVTSFESAEGGEQRCCAAQSSGACGSCAADVGAETA
jgi:hypothetical protein